MSTTTTTAAAERLHQCNQQIVAHKQALDSLYQQHATLRKEVLEERKQPWKALAQRVFRVLQGDEEGCITNTHLAMLVLASMLQQKDTGFYCGKEGEAVLTRVNDIGGWMDCMTIHTADRSGMLYSSQYNRLNHQWKCIDYVPYSDRLDLTSESAFIASVELCGERAEEGFGKRYGWGALTQPHLQHICCVSADRALALLQEALDKRQPLVVSRL